MIIKKEKERVEEFAKKFHDKNVHIRYVLGAFGDVEDCVGVVEEEVFPKEGGSFIKYLGCSYLQRGCPLGVIPMELIECYGLAKRILLRVATDIFQNKLLGFFIFLFWLFNRKGFYLLLNKYTTDINHKTVNALIFDEKRYNRFPTELRRAMKLAFKKELGDEKMAEMEKWLRTYYEGNDKILRFYLPLYRMTELIIFLVDFDTAYRFPAQDVLSELNKNNDTVKELQRLTDILIDRSMSCFKDKATMIKKTIPIMRFFPPIKRLLKNFFEELNIDEIKMDEADWYWCLRRKLYNFKNVPLSERLKEAEKIDKEREHVKVKFDISFSEEDFRRKYEEAKIRAQKSWEENKEHTKEGQPANR